MIDIANIKSLYFIGIGGIGMSALARYFNAQHVTVSGYDKTPTELTRQLEQEGISIHYEDNIDYIPKDVSIVVYTPAIPTTHNELVWYQSNGYVVIKRSDLLEAVTQHTFTIAIAGTHGKTTTSTLVAHILKHSGYNCTAFLGGISVNYNQNYIEGARHTIVVEADEYDRSFLKLHPDIAIITSTDADHLDIYGDISEVEKSYTQFANKTKPKGNLIIKKNLSIIKNIKNHHIYTYGITVNDSDAYADNISIINGCFVFTYKGLDKCIPQICLTVPGMHNVENAVAAITVALILGIETDKIKLAVAAFKGVKRRFEYVVNKESTIYIDDYAHHPKEIESFLTAVKSLYPEKKVTCIFQPHLYTRTRDFLEGFAQTLSMADNVILLPIYPARELPIDGVTSQLILEKIHSTTKVICEKNEIIDLIESKKPELLVTLGAGDIDQLVLPLKELLSKLS